jgi:hypothetical protein
VEERPVFVRGPDNRLVTYETPVMPVKPNIRRAHAQGLYPVCERRDSPLFVETRHDVTRSSLEVDGCAVKNDLHGGVRAMRSLPFFIFFDSLDVTSRRASQSETSLTDPRHHRIYYLFGYTIRPITERDP